MIKCKICFKSSEDLKMTPFNDQYVSYFNLLTNLKIQVFDVTRQQLCENCIEMLNLFVEFRNKCILAHSVMQTDYVFEEVMKQQTTKEKNDHFVKYEIIKTEINENPENSTDVNYEHGFTNIDDQFLNDLVDMNVKPEKNVKGCSKELGNKNISTTAQHQFPCGLCSKSFDDKSSMSNHIESHKNDKMCLLCKEKCIDWQQLFSHRLEHVQCKDKICHICFKRFKTSSYLEYHYKNIHSVNEKILLRCLLCNKSSKTPRLLQKHIWRCHSDKKFICDYCSKEFKTKQQMKTHVAIHMERKPFACDQCDFSCNFYSNLKTHKLSRHTPERVYCRKCNRVFGSRLIRDKHKCLSKLSMCPTCGKTFYGTRQLTRHMESHDAVGRYRCERCPAAFKTSNALHAHRDRHDGVRSKRCEYCPKAFYTTCVLIKHRRTHTGIKPYVCSICQKAFTGNNNLKVHMRVHGEYLITKKVQNNIENVNTKSAV
ncbi:unnamed protein product [Euphydryas editha]|uniref:Uncharacterized protein n=1 Tax=Euphydryas editha TaxID=104508 RepID=A0AAU9V899_EUPED|nr:unnamed protein product [Euphydryas editha]